MRIEPTKLLLANGLKDIILYRLSGTFYTEQAFAYVETYQNGREQGYTITLRNNEINTRRIITISECRNSDSIMVYTENTANQGLDEESYRNGKSFTKDAYKEVIEHCTEYLLS